MPIDVRRNDERSRYEARVDDRLVAIADFRVAGDTVVFPHTEVVPDMRGQGVGQELVRAALDDVRSGGRRVRALCWYVRQFLEEHEEYGDLVA